MVVISVFVFGISFADVVEIFEIRYRSASDALGIVEKLLTKEGSVTMDVRTNSLVVKDSDESVGRIKKIISDFDKAIETAKIRVRFSEKKSDSGRVISGGGSIGNDDWKISAGSGRKGFEARLEDVDKSVNAGSEYFVTVASGSPAYIVTGKSIPYREKWVHIGGKRVISGDAVHFEKIETGIEIIPVIRGDHADIRIVPRISDGGDKGGIIRFAEASTRMTVPLGKWVTIGGADQKENEILNAVLEKGSGTQGSSFSVSIMIEK
jgi:type II secretory pathway component GspD/PulD (secretin)